MAGTNPLAGAFSASASTSRNPLAGAFGPAATTSKNPLAGAFGGSSGKTVASNIGDALDYQRSKSQEAIFHKGSNDANRAALRKSIGADKDYDDPRLFGTGPGSFGIPVPAWATHLGRGLTDTALDTVTDPLTFEGGAIGKLAKGTFGLGAKALGAAEKLPVVGASIANATEGVTHLGNAIHDSFTHAGKATRELGKPAVDFALGAKTKTASHETELDARLQKKFESIRGTLSDDDFATALQIQKGERQATTNEGRLIVTPEAAGAAASLKHLFRQAYALRADESGQRRIANYAVGDRPATSKTVVANVKPQINEIEATRDIEQNNAARGRIVAAFAKEALPTVEQDPGFLSAMQHLRDYRVGGKAMTKEQLEKNAERLKETTAHRIAGDRFAAMSPEERDLATINAGGTRRVDSTGGNRYVTNAGPAFGGRAASADAPSKVIGKLNDGNRPIIDRSKRSFNVTARAASTPYKIDDDLAEFAGQPGSLSWQQNKRNYVPGPREAKAVDPNKESQSFNLLDKFDPNAEHQGDFTIDPTNAAPIAEAVRGMLKNTASQVGRAELHKELEQRFGKSLPPEITKLFDVTTKATGDARTPREKAADVVRSVVEMPKRAVVGVLPRHAFNVASLAALNDPRSTAKAVAQAARILKNPETRYDELRTGIESGAIGPRAEHESPSLGWLDSLLNKAGPAGQLPRKYSKFINDMTWALDESAVNQMAKARGGGYSAGRDARKALVDYDNPSRFTQQAKNIAPFATFETGIPGAVAKAIGRNPRRAEAANRLTGGTLLGGDTQIDGHDVRLNLPTAKVGRLLGSGDVPEFVRGGLADPVRALASLATSGNPHFDPKHYMTYGLDPRKPADAFKILTNMAAGGIPEARDVLDQLGDGPYKPNKNFLESLLQNASGVSVK